MPLELPYADFSRFTSGSAHRKDVYRMCAGVPHTLFLWHVLLSDDKSSFSHERPPSLSSNFWIIKGSGLFSQLEQRPRKDRVPWASFPMSSFFSEQSQGETLGAKFTRVNTRRTNIFFTIKCTPGKCLMQFLNVSSVTSQSVWLPTLLWRPWALLEGCELHLFRNFPDRLFLTRYHPVGGPVEDDKWCFSLL